MGVLADIGRSGAGTTIQSALQGIADERRAKVKDAQDATTFEQQQQLFPEEKKLLQKQVETAGFKAEEAKRAHMDATVPLDKDTVMSKLGIRTTGGRKEVEKLYAQFADLDGNITADKLKEIKAIIETPEFLYKRGEYWIEDVNQKKAKLQAEMNNPDSKAKPEELQEQQAKLIEEGLAATQAFHQAKYTYTREMINSMPGAPIVKQAFMELGPSFDIMKYQRDPEYNSYINDIVHTQVKKWEKQEGGATRYGAPVPGIDPVTGETNLMRYSPDSLEGVEVKGQRPKLTASESDDETVEDIAQMIVDENAVPSMYGKRRGYTQKIHDEISKKYPNFSIAHAEANYKYKTNAANLQSIALINGVTPLFDNLLENGEALKNSNFQPWNKIVNEAKKLSGGDKVVAFTNARDGMVAEVERVLLGSGVLSDSKYNRAITNISTSQSWPQMKAAVKQMKFEVEARRHALDTPPYILDKTPADEIGKKETSKKSDPLGLR